MKTRLLTAVALVALCTLAFAGGCQSGTATTQPTPATLTTDAIDGLTTVVDVLDGLVNAGVIPKAVYRSDVAPFVHAAQAASKDVQAAVKSGDANAYATASKAFADAMAKIRPFLAKGDKPTTRPSTRPAKG